MRLKTKGLVESSFKQLLDFALVRKEGIQYSEFAAYKTAEGTRGEVQTGESHGYFSDFLSVF